ncbi:hypothetical protein [Marinobacterium rhizophilum]|uniref:Uncharacterized protein n=1 Tax=Marinobacterium rhizophilum TaxID=420402 RepID=A0ABY5HL18_9GAMM|nr:hypothetical protein [Marinobacterium rhizophilum]UTW12819.1 hypothetical protein KDW95_03845 [Marinobacterium rhizophilum]
MGAGKNYYNQGSQMLRGATFIDRYKNMTALLVSVIVWGIVAFMSTDDYCRMHEKNALRFFVVTGIGLAVVGVWNFEIDHFILVSIHDWLLVGFFPIFLLYLRFKKKIDGNKFDNQNCELEIDASLDQKLVRRLRALTAIMWAYAALIMVVHVWSRI